MPGFPAQYGQSSPNANPADPPAIPVQKKIRHRQPRPSLGPARAGAERFPGTAWTAANALRPTGTSRSLSPFPMQRKQPMRMSKSETRRPINSETRKPGRVQHLDHGPVAKPVRGAQRSGCSSNRSTSSMRR